MESTTESQAVLTWIASFGAALDSNTNADYEALFESDAYWRNVLALGWSINTVSGASAIAKDLATNAAQSRLSEVRIDTDATPPRRVVRAGVDCIEAFICFQTRTGTGKGVVRFKCDESGNASSPGLSNKAWTLLTALQELKGFEESVGANRPTGQVHSRDFQGPNWLDRRQHTAAFSDREPAVLVVGAGQAGLSIAARLTQLGVDTLVIEKNERVGDNWRNRYHALTLHNQVYANHLPYMPFPPNWPVYIPKDKLANWLEAYAEAMELNVWTNTALLESHYDETEQCWNATIQSDSEQSRLLKPRHIVMATSVSGLPNLPVIAGLDNYNGDVVHASAYRDGLDHKGKSALVIGMGTSGHDIAQDLASNGADVTMVQRGSTMIVNVEPGAQLPYALYHEGPGLDECVEAGRTRHATGLRSG